VDSADNKKQEEYRRLMWHSRRGMLELDVVLLPFTENVYLTLSEQDQQCYKRLIDCEDPDLFQWITENGKSDDAELQRMIEIILDYARNR
jgi:antitoxin CptB